MTVLVSFHACGEAVSGLLMRRGSVRFSGVRSLTLMKAHGTSAEQIDREVERVKAEFLRLPCSPEDGAVVIKLLLERPAA